MPRDEVPEKIFEIIPVKFYKNAPSKYRGTPILERKRMMKSLICVGEASIFWLFCVKPSSFYAFKQKHALSLNIFREQGGKNLLAGRAMPSVLTPNFVPGPMHQKSQEGLLHTKCSV